MSCSVKGSEEYREFSQDFGMEEEEDLFEIDLDAVNCISPPDGWESYCTSTGNIALLANCLLPISDVSCAVPAVSFAGKSNVLLITEPSSLGEYLSLPFLGALGVVHENMEAQFHFQFQR
ncbi:uncharacterized protein LOC114914974 [Cajanus cajan]|uniref:Uncharacterized protein n=1 Tax=Cajanus cajan TaxID=3821 RepID=A0A151RIY7_CAJCA|nr:uncharacterized protein LOC114914974 [Cajanus cajan]KYP42552.1 hypothetical protein KK1_036031 [Cajanus cajan]